MFIVQGRQHVGGGNLIEEASTDAFTPCRPVGRPSHLTIAVLVIAPRLRRPALMNRAARVSAIQFRVGGAGCDAIERDIA